MNDIHLVAIVNSFQELEDVLLDQVALQAGGALFQYLEQCPVDELEDQVQFAFPIFKNN